MNTAKYIVLILVLGISLILSAQQEIRLNINHHLGEDAFQMNAISQNNLGNVFDVIRMQYYLCGFVIIHDGGQETALPDAYVLANAADTYAYTLGEASFTDIEAIRFMVGVDSTYNHADPALWPADHPLALQNPSTHWGWASGYRFVMIEGSGGATAADTPYEIHGLGDQNFKSSVELTVYPEDMGSYTQLSIDADYNGALQNIDVSSGLNNHGMTGEAASVIANMRLYVFSEVEAPSTEIAQLEDSHALRVYPNPVSSDLISISYELQGYHELKATLLDLTGKIIYSEALDSHGTSLLLPSLSTGMYFLHITSGKELIERQQISVQ